VPTRLPGLYPWPYSDFLILSRLLEGLRSLFRLGIFVVALGRKGLVVNSTRDFARCRRTDLNRRRGIRGDTEGFLSVGQQKIGEELSAFRTHRQRAQIDKILSLHRPCHKIRPVSFDLLFGQSQSDGAL
jgi:hypothetical protein